MPKKTKQPSTQDGLKQIAFVVTVGSAMLYGVLWGATGLFVESDVTPEWVGVASTVLWICLVVGGISMGLLHLYSKKK